MPACASVKKKVRSCDSDFFMGEKKKNSFDEKYPILSDLVVLLYLCVANMFPVTLRCKELLCVQVPKHGTLQGNLKAEEKGMRVDLGCD